MGIFDGCLLASDIDGTLLENGYINPENIKKIEYFISEGGAFSLSTGRTIAAVSDVLESIKNISPSVVANGCMVYDFKNHKPLYEKIIPDEDYEVINKILGMGYPLGMEVHSRENVFTLSNTKETRLHQEYEKMPTVLANFDDIAKLKINKVLLTFSNLEEKEQFKKILIKENLYAKINSAFVDTCAVIGGVVQHYYELVPKGVSKATALSELCKILRIKKGCYFSIGDYYNDIEMIKTADISAAPISSPEDIKSEAKYITVPCKDGAVADFIDYLSKLNAK